MNNNLFKTSDFFINPLVIHYLLLKQTQEQQILQIHIVSVALLSIQSIQRRTHLLTHSQAPPVMPLWQISPQDAQIWPRF